MELPYAFSSLCGASYEGGSVLFAPPAGTSLLAPCGNRIDVHDLRHNRIVTLPIEARSNIKHLLLSPTSPILLSIDETGRCLIINFVNGVVLGRIFFKSPVACAAFSPCGQYIAVCKDRLLQIWLSPSVDTAWQLTLHRGVQHHLSRIRSIDWSSDSRFLVTASDDLTARIFSVDPYPGFKPTTFVDHRYPLVGAYFSTDMRRIFSVSVEGVLISWRWVSGVEDFSENEGLESRGHHIRHWARARKGPSLSEALAGEVDEGPRVKEEVGSSDDGEEGKAIRDSDASREADSSDSTATGGKDSRKLRRKKFADFTEEGGKWVLDCKAYCSIAKKRSGDADDDDLQAVDAASTSAKTISGKVHESAFNKKLGLLVVGYTSGVVSIYECPEFYSLYTLSIGSQPLTSVSLTPDGQWIAMASAELGQLVVWEWKSETYILRQQGHHLGVTCAATAPAVDVSAATAKGVATARDMSAVSRGVGLGHRSTFVATGGEDGKVKVWDVESGFNFVTFLDHSATVTDIVFTPQGNAIVSSSQDGTVRAFDLTRFKNFRTFTAPTVATQFGCVAVDSAGEIVVAGASVGEFAVYLWSMQTGKLLESLSGHEGPVSSVAFNLNPNSPGLLVSASWDSTLRVWDVYGRAGKGGAAEPLIGTSGVLAVAFDPRGNNQLAAATFAGNIWFWNFDEGEVIGSIEGIRDILSGRMRGGRFTANNTRGKLTAQERKTMGSTGSGVNLNQHFNSLVYSSNGSWLLAGSKFSPRVCVYSTEKHTLTQVFTLTHNRSLDGLLVELNSRSVMETGFAIEDYDLSDDEDTYTRTQRRIKDHLTLPGVGSGALKVGKKQRQFNCWGLAFSQNGQHWCAATSHGLFVFTISPAGGAELQVPGHSSQYQADQLAPFLMTRNVTPQNIEKYLAKREFSRALVLALSLNDLRYMSLAYHAVPYDSIVSVVQAIPSFMLCYLLNFLRICLSEVVISGEKGDQHVKPLSGSPHLQHHLKWLSSIFTTPAHLQCLQNFDSAADSPDMYRGISEQYVSAAKSGAAGLQVACLLLLKNVQRVHNLLGNVMNENVSTLDYILCRGQQ